MSLEKSMSHYLIDQIRTKSNIRTALRSEVKAVYGETHMTALDIFDRGANEVRREELGGTVCVHRRRRRNQLAAA